jgi:transcription termination/antitermination protein NusA
MSVNMTELKQMIEFVCSEKGIEIEEIVKAIERAIASAYRKEHGDKDKTYIGTFNLDTGSYKVFEETKIVEEVLFPAKEQLLSEARLYNPKAQVGDLIHKEMVSSSDLDFGRIASQIGRQVLMQSINASRHTKILKDFKDKIGEIVNIEIDYMKKGGYLVKLGQTSAFMSKEAFSPADRLKPGQVIKAIILDIKEDELGNSKIILSRSAPEFVSAIIKQEIPEVDNGIVIIDKIVREAGFRTKILVSAPDDDRIDPVGTILGRKNIRILNIMRELNPSIAEKIDVIEYNPEDLTTMIMDALEPAQIEKIDIDEDSQSANVHCYSDEAFLAVGKRGVNIRLASRLLDLALNIITIDAQKSPSQNVNIES